PCRRTSSARACAACATWCRSSTSSAGRAGCCSTPRACATARACWHEHERRAARQTPPSGMAHASPPLQPHSAFFLDIDGTLLDIAPTPKSVHTARADCKLVVALYDKADGALALVSGRSLATIDELFAPLRLPAAGQHGVERRDARGRV